MKRSPSADGEECRLEVR
ncbi:hypothetical protein E2C01_092827 [Portunus trituberculatus]|uniref:Uncharacterized protein n=1 Tax=Portunus trituberculatus TaxID=210409 RepID=A0A5B7JRP2_PORTR|nr:hypothetical protein [Portunus trituberculatus]